MVKKSHERPYIVVPQDITPVPEGDKLFNKVVKRRSKDLEKAGKPKFTTEVRLVRGNLRKNACKDKSGGAICGSVYEEITRDGIGRIVKSVCYPNKHERKLKQRKDKVA